MNILECNGVHMRYGAVCAVENVSFCVKAHDFLCVVGENGSGKTTLMKGILGLMKPSAGAIRLGVKRSEIGYMPQQTAVQRLFPASVFEVVVSGCLNRPDCAVFFCRREKERARRYMAYLGIADLAKKPYANLSGGQQQRVLLARALCSADKLLLLDEPVAGLDPACAREMYTLLKKINSDAGTTVIMISHDIKNSIKCATKVLHMQTTPLFFGTVAEYAETIDGAKMIRGGENV